MTEEHFLTPNQTQELIGLGLKINNPLFKWSTKYSLVPELMFMVDFNPLYDIPALMTSELLLELPGFQLTKTFLQGHYSLGIKPGSSFTESGSLRDLVYEKYKQHLIESW